jgi:hypothetical protein
MNLRSAASAGRIYEQKRMKAGVRSGAIPNSGVGVAAQKFLPPHLNIEGLCCFRARNEVNNQRNKREQQQ